VTIDLEFRRDPPGWTQMNVMEVLSLCAKDLTRIIVTPKTGEILQSPTRSDNDDEVSLQGAAFSYNRLYYS